MAVLEHQLAPALQRLALGLDWLNIDFQQNIGKLMERAVTLVQDKLGGHQWLESFSMASLLSRSPEVLHCR